MERIGYISSINTIEITFVLSCILPLSSKRLHLPYYKVTIVVVFNLFDPHFLMKKNT